MIKSYKKIPEKVQAVLWTGDLESELAIEELISDKIIQIPYTDKIFLPCNTVVDLWSYVVKYPSGYISTYNDKNFEKEYEEVNEEK